MRSTTTTGIICLDDSYGLTYRIAKITYIEWEDETFEYQIEPCYPVIDLLKPDLFQGIPGLDLSLRKTVYRRTNMTPTFIEERTPGPKRENLQELLEGEGMQYLNRLEWLIRTDLRYSGDCLYVRRWQPSDDERIIALEELSVLGTQSGQQARGILQLLCMGHIIETPSFTIDDGARSTVYHLLLSLYKANRTFAEAHQKAGIERAKQQGKYRGRKPKSINLRDLDAAAKRYFAKTITAKEAAASLGVSPATFHRRLRRLYPERYQ